MRLSGGLHKKERSKAVATKMLALFETPAGFALFKVLNEKKLDNVEVRGSSQLDTSWLIQWVSFLGLIASCLRNDGFRV